MPASDRKNFLFDLWSYFILWQGMFGISAFFSWKSKRRVTSYELRVQIHELRAQIYQLRVQIHELRVQIHELQVQIHHYKFKFTSYEFKFTSLASVSLKPHTKILKNLFHNMALKNIYVTPKLPTYFSIGHKIRTY